MLPPLAVIVSQSRRTRTNLILVLLRRILVEGCGSLLCSASIVRVLLTHRITTFLLASLVLLVLGFLLTVRMLASQSLEFFRSLSHFLPTDRRGSTLTGCSHFTLSRALAIVSHRTQHSVLFFHEKRVCVVSLGFATFEALSRGVVGY